MDCVQNTFGEISVSLKNGHSQEGQGTGLEEQGLEEIELQTRTSSLVKGHGNALANNAPFSFINCFSEAWTQRHVPRDNIEMLFDNEEGRNGHNHASQNECM